MSLMAIARQPLALMLALASVMASVLAPQLALAAAAHWHTSPACWPSPRWTHAPLSPELAARVRLETASGVRLMSGELSPNGGYRYQLQQLGADWQLLVDLESGRSLRLTLQQPAAAPGADWINEKLIRLRVPWGRRVGSDLILDVEQARLIFHEQVEDGTLAFEQFRQACGGQCPCPVDAPAGAAAAVPTNASPQHAQAPPPADPPDPAEDGLRLTGLVRPGPVDVASLQLLAAPQASAARVATGGAALRQREVAYEEAAFSVYGRRPGWYRLRLQSGVYVWAEAAALGEFIALRELLEGRMHYLGQDWDGALAASPGGEPRSVASAGERAVQLQALQWVDGRLWAQVALYRVDPCQGGAGELAASGWLRLHQGDGEPLLWYWSRGC